MTSSPRPPLTAESLLVHREWVRALARRLVADDSRADDLEQDAWLAALRSPPQDGSSPRAWLATVLRNFARKAHRGDERRARRERASARPEAAPSTAEIVAEADAHRRVVLAVFGLAEPHRTTILLRYFEGLPVAD